MSNIHSKRERERDRERQREERERRDREGETERQRDRERETERERERGNKCLSSYITLHLFLTIHCGEGLYILNLHGYKW